MNSRYRIRQSDTYLKDYEKELQYSVKNWGAEHADKYFRKLENKIKALEDNPHINAAKPNLPKDVRYFFDKGHYVTYKIDDQRKEITMLRMFGRDKFHIWEKQIVERRTEKTADKDKDDYKTQKEDPIERRMRKLEERNNQREQEQDRGDRSR